MMNSLREYIRWLTPFGLVERHRRIFQMQRLGLIKSKENAVAVKSCRYELWPSRLRNAEYPWTLIDVGANVGDFTAATARLAKLKSVYAFEPQQECHAALGEVLKTIPDSYLNKSAVGNQCDEIDLICTLNSKLASVLTPGKQIANQYQSRDFNITKRIKVPLVSLDEVIPEGTSIGLLKIDVQGYELPVLEGATITLRDTYALLMEVNYVSHYESGATFDTLYEAVRKHGFHTFGVSEPYGGRDGPLWADAMFVKDAKKFKG